MGMPQWGLLPKYRPHLLACLRALGANDGPGMRDRNFTVIVAVCTVATCAFVTRFGAPRPEAIMGQIEANTEKTHHLLSNTWSGTVTFNSANVMALRHFGPNGAGAMAFQRGVDGAEMGAVGYKNESGAWSYLHGAVYLAGGAYTRDGKPIPGGPRPVILGQEGHFNGQMHAAPRITLDRDWTITFHDHNRAAHTKVSEAGAWEFTQAVQSLYDRFGPEAPEDKVAAPPGATYRRTGPVDGARFFVKQTGHDVRGWVEP